MKRIFGTPMGAFLLCAMSAMNAFGQQTYNEME